MLGYGDVEIRVTDYGRQRVFRLYDVAYCKGIQCNLVSLQKLKSRGFWWDTKPQKTLIRRQLDDSIIYDLREEFGQYVLEYNPRTIKPTVFPILTGRRNKINS